MTAPDVVILVPRRDGIADRDALWSYCRAFWEREFPEWRIVEGHHDVGLFNRSAAVNRAASLAGDWDVAILIDSDVLVDPPSVRAAVPLAVESGQVVVPFELRHNLSRYGTRRIMEGDTGSWKRYIVRTFRFQHSSVVVIPRALWDDVGGFDEGFRGWGFEDTAFALSAEVVASRPLGRLPGEVWHLHHESNKAEKHGSPSHRANAARIEPYREAHALNDRAAMLRLVASGRDSVDPEVDQIPRILHRVVPADVPAVAEEWWQAFQSLHPGWRFMTHQDPLTPGDWPMTSRHWGRCKVGAQLADLVRLEALYRWGGFYVDMDVQPFRSFEPLLGAGVVAAWEDERSIPNAIMGARPGHEAIKQCLDLCIRGVNRGDVWEGGPGALTKTLPAHPDALLLPPGAFYDVHYRDPERDQKMTGPASPWTYARHHYWGSWLDESRRRTPAA